MAVTIQDTCIRVLALQGSLAAFQLGETVKTPRFYSTVLYAWETSGKYA